MEKGKFILDAYALKVEQHNRNTFDLWNNMLTKANTRIIIGIGLTDVGSISVATVPGADPDAVLRTLKDIVAQWEGKLGEGSNLVKLE